MADKLTDRDELLTPPLGDDLVYVVDISDSADGPEGTSKKQQVADFLRGRVFGKNINVTGQKANTLILNMSNTANHPSTQGLANDFVLFMDETDTRIIIGVAIDTVAAFPADLDDPLKFIKFHEGNKLIP